ncbi:hypothetical protein ZWY2020_001696 [Hordeum vulgare]|nr:hypothetical protein ZWY2020_001696 [Hordeum vulgare]
MIPFYTLMIAAPNANITERTVESTAPYVALGILYTYLLYLCWTTDTIRAMFASKYWLPEGPRRAPVGEGAELAPRAPAELAAP